MRLINLFLCSLLLILTPVATTAQDPLQSKMVFEPADGSNSHVHASCVIEYPNGDLLSVWYENGEMRDDYYYTLDQDKSDDVRIGAARLRKGADQWSKPFVISDTFGVADNNPCLIVDKQNRLWLFHTAMMAAPIDTWGSGLICYKVSSNYQDQAEPIWDKEAILIVHPKGLDTIVAQIAYELRRDADYNNSNARHATRMLEALNDHFKRRLGWMTRAHPLIMPDGTLMLPLSNENFNIPMMASTNDGGETWTMSNVVPSAGLIQPSVVRFPSGRLSAFFRDGTDANRIQRSNSLDDGMTWTPATVTALPNPGSGIEAITLQSGLLAMVYNDQTDSPRDRLAIALSDDEGVTWTWKRIIEHIQGGRFDYPSVIQSRDGSIHVSFSYNLKTVKHVQFSEAWIKDGD